MPCLHSLGSWAMHFNFARLRLTGKMIIIPRLRLGQIIFIGALIKCLSLNNPPYNYQLFEAYIAGFVLLQIVAKLVAQISHLLFWAYEAKVYQFALQLEKSPEKLRKH